jgi:hypothetical protein
VQVSLQSPSLGSVSIVATSRDVEFATDTHRQRGLENNSKREGTKISCVRNQLTLKSHHSQLSEQGLLNSPLMRVEPYNPFIDHAVRNVHSNQRKPKIMEPFACRLQLYQP